MIYLHPLSKALLTISTTQRTQGPREWNLHILPQILAMEILLLIHLTTTSQWKAGLRSRSLFPVYPWSRQSGGPPQTRIQLMESLSPLEKWSTRSWVLKTKLAPFFLVPIRQKILVSQLQSIFKIVVYIKFFFVWTLLNFLLKSDSGMLNNTYFNNFDTFNNFFYVMASAGLYSLIYINNLQS